MIFNQTFGLDQSTVYPPKQNRAKTILEQFQQTKKGLPWLLASKAIQFIVAFLWLLLIYTIAKGLFELWKVSKEPAGSARRIAHRKVLTCESIISIMLVSLSLYTLTIIVFIRQEWIRQNLMQGFAIWIIILVVRTKVMLWMIVYSNIIQRMKTVQATIANCSLINTITTKSNQSKQMQIKTQDRQQFKFDAVQDMIRHFISLLRSGKDTKDSRYIKDTIFHAIEQSVHCLTYCITSFKQYLTHQTEQDTNFQVTDPQKQRYTPLSFCKNKEKLESLLGQMIQLKNQDEVEESFSSSFLQPQLNNMELKCQSLIQQNTQMKLEIRNLTQQIKHQKVEISQLKNRNSKLILQLQARVKNYEKLSTKYTIVKRQNKRLIQIQKQSLINEESLNKIIEQNQKQIQKTCSQVRQIKHYFNSLQRQFKEAQGNDNKTKQSLRYKSPQTKFIEPEIPTQTTIGSLSLSKEIARKIKFNIGSFQQKVLSLS